MVCVISRTACIILLAVYMLYIYMYMYVYIYIYVYVYMCNMHNVYLSGSFFSSQHELSLVAFGRQPGWFGYFSGMKSYPVLLGS